MKNKNSEWNCSPTEVRVILTNEPIDEASVLLILESMLMPLLKSGASYKKLLKAGNNKNVAKSEQEELKIKNIEEIPTLPAQFFKESA